MSRGYLEHVYDGLDKASWGVERAGFGCEVRKRVQKQDEVACS